MKKEIKIIPTLAGTAWEENKEYRLLDYIVLEGSVVYMSKRVDPETMVNVGHPLSDTTWWDKSMDLSEAETITTDDITALFK